MSHITLNHFLLVLSIGMLSIGWGSEAVAQTSLSDQEIREWVVASMSELDTMFYTAIREGRTEPCLADSYADHIGSILDEGNIIAARAAIDHLNELIKSYSDPVQFSAPNQTLLTKQRLILYSIEGQAALLDAFTTLDLRASDHLFASKRINEFNNLPQHEISNLVKANMNYTLGYVEYFDGNFAASGAAFEASAAFANSIGDIVYTVQSLDASASVYYESGNYSDALRSSEAAMKLLSAQRNPDSLKSLNINLFLNYAEALFRTGQSEKAYSIVGEATVLHESFPDADLKGRIDMTWGRLYNMDHKYAQAITYLEAALKQFEDIDELYLLNTSLKDLAVAYEGAGKYKLALKSYQRYTEQTESLAKSRQRETVDKLVADNALAVHEREVALLQAQKTQLFASNQTSHYQLAGTFLLLGLITFVCVYVVNRLRIRRQAHDKLELMVAERTLELEQHARQLERSNADLERFAYIASHDLKTPIRNVTSFLNLIERRLTPEARMQVADYLKIAIDNARQMHHLVTDVLEFSKIDANVVTQSTRFDVEDRIRSMVSQIQPELTDKNAKVSITGQLELFAPLQHITQLIRNLIENGIKYNESGCPRIDILLAQVGSTAIIKVTDNGIGIDASYHSQIFHLFKRLHTSDEYAGTGLGLAVCKKVVDRLGGEISVTSAERNGSTFTIELPVDCTVEQPIYTAPTRTNVVQLAPAMAN